MKYTLFESNKKIQLFHQKSENWCFAAASQMVLNSKNNNKSQEEIINSIKGLSNTTIIDCANPPKNKEGEFFKPLAIGQLDAWINFFKINGFPATKLLNLNRNDLLYYITKGPIIGLFEMNGDFKHAMVITKVKRPKDYKINKFLELEIYNPGEKVACTGGKIQWVRWDPIINIISAKDFHYAVGKFGHKNEFYNMNLIVPLEINEPNNDNKKLAYLREYDTIKSKVLNFSFFGTLNKIKKRKSKG